MKEVLKEFKKIKMLNKPVRGNDQWIKNPVVVITPLSWLEDFSNNFPLASRQRVLGETKGSVGVLRIEGTDSSWAICHLDTGTIVKQVENESVDEVKKEAERYGQIFDQLKNSTLTFETVQEVIRQCLTLDDLKNKNPEKFKMELN